MSLSFYTTALVNCDIPPGTVPAAPRDNHMCLLLLMAQWKQTVEMKGTGHPRQERLNPSDSRAVSLKLWVSKQQVSRGQVM
jgi:hypothetical protein